MEISEVRIKLVEERGERLRAFCSITLDGDFVIRDLKIIDGLSGPFVAMPSRKLADRCPRCGCKNHLRAKYCNDCGLKLNENRAPKDAMGRAKLHADVAHPINAACRERIQAAVVKAYEQEVERSKSPDYKPPVYDDFGDDDVSHLVEAAARPVPAVPVAAPPPPPPPPPVEVEDEDEVEPAPEPEPVARAQGEFSDYNSLIADLKREAAARHGRGDAPDSMPPPPRPAPPARSGQAGTRDNAGGRSDRGGGPRPPGRGDRFNRQDRGPRRQGRGPEESRPPFARDERRGESTRRGPAPGDDRDAVPAVAAPAPPPKPQASAPPPAQETDDFAAGL